jgi:hypothetical protein
MFPAGPRELAFDDAPGHRTQDILPLIHASKKGRCKAALFRIPKMRKAALQRPFVETYC